MRPPTGATRCGGHLLSGADVHGRWDGAGTVQVRRTRRHVTQTAGPPAHIRERVMTQRWTEAAIWSTSRAGRGSVKSRFISWAARAMATLRLSGSTKTDYPNIGGEGLLFWFGYIYRTVRVVSYSQRRNPF